MYKTLFFPFEAFRAVKLIQQIAPTLSGGMRIHPVDKSSALRGMQARQVHGIFV